MEFQKIMSKTNKSTTEDSVKLDDEMIDKATDTQESESDLASKKRGRPKKAETENNIMEEEAVEENVKPAITVHYSDEKLEEFKQVIFDAKQEAYEELTMLKERLDDLTNYDFAEESMIYSMHMAEQGSEAQEKEKTYAQIQRINEYLKKLDEALNRIADKTYGICRVCNCLIAEERLRAVPVTTLSASYKIHTKCPEDGIDKIERRS